MCRWWPTDSPTSEIIIVPHYMSEWWLPTVPSNKRFFIVMQLVWNLEYVWNACTD